MNEWMAFIRSFVKEIALAPGRAVIRYPMPTPKDNSIRGRAVQEIALSGPVLFTVHRGGPECTVGGTVFEMWLGNL